MRLRDLLVTIRATLEEHPEFIDLPVYVVDTASGVLYDSPSIGDSTVSESEQGMSALDEDEIGKPFVAIYVD